MMPPGRVSALACAAFTALLARAACRAEPAGLVLVDKGRANCAIVVDPRASRDVRFAAEELQKYLEKVSGAEVPIGAEALRGRGPMILVGDSAPARASRVSATALAAEGFKIKTAGGNLVLLGRDDAGTQFAVYTFLERYLGVRWLWPGESGEVVPRKASIVIQPIDDTEEPDFKWRNRGPGGALWGAPQGPTEMRARERLLGVSAEHQAEVARWERRNKWGGMKIYGGHALGEIFPPEKYARTHPEYYALVDGKRAVPGADYDYKHAGQVCTTNPGVLRATVEWVRAFFDRHPDYHGVHVTMNDGGGFCECDRCRALDSGELIKRPGIDIEELKKAPARNTVITDRIFTFVNQVAEEVEKTHPGKYVVSMAYSRYASPPRRVRLRPSVIPQYCLWSAYRHANAAFKDEHEKTAAAWARAARRAAIYEYYINGSWPGLHRLFVPQMAESIKYLRRQEIDLYQTQSGDDFAINGINYYVAARLLWNSSLDAPSILNDFYQKGFGKAAPAISRYHRRLQEAWRLATEGGEDVSCNSIEKTRLLELFTPELLETCAADLAEASAVAEDEAVRKRVGFYRQGLRYTELTVAAVRAARQAIERPEPGLVAAALDAWAQRDRFVEELKNDYVIAYFWVKYNDAQRNFHPVETLRKLSTSAAQSLPRYDIHRASSPIVIDARLDEPAWREAPPAGDFHFNRWKSGEKERTVARMLWDDENLYVSYLCRDRHISAHVTERHGPVSNDDCVEIFLSPNPDKVTNYYTFEINAIGTMLNRCRTDWWKGPPTWEPEGVRYRASFHGWPKKDESPADDHWIVELAIPLRNFVRDAAHTPPRDGDLWRLNLNRTGGITNRQGSTWSPIAAPATSFHTPQSFGWVCFVNRPPAPRR